MNEEFKSQTQVTAAGVWSFINNDKAIKEFPQAPVIIGVLAVASGLSVALVKETQEREALEYFVDKFTEITNKMKIEMEKSIDGKS